LGERLWAGLLALRTRQTLLFLGAFLLVISALILVIFNWASFPPILQFALLAGVCGGLWAGGYWISAHWGLSGAGAGLRLVAAVLTPVVIFSLSRPGLLDFAPRAGWLLASALSLPIYALAAWKVRHSVYSAAACLAAASALLAALSFAEPAWLPAALAVIASGVLLLSRGLKQRAPELAAGPMWIAHGSVPLAVAWSSYGIADPTMSPWILAATLWAAAGFYALAAWQQQFPLWAWFAAALAPLGLLASLAAADAAPLWWALAPALLALIYLGLGVSLEPHARRYSMPAYMGMAGLALLALAYGMSLETARLALPLPATYS
jgi:hypothetical protein